MLRVLFKRAPRRLRPPMLYSLPMPIAGFNQSAAFIPQREPISLPRRPCRYEAKQTRTTAPCRKDLAHLCFVDHRLHRRILPKGSKDCPGLETARFRFCFTHAGIRAGALTKEETQ